MRLLQFSILSFYKNFMNQGSEHNSSDRRSPPLSSAATRLLSYFLLHPKRDNQPSEVTVPSLLFRFRIKPSNDKVFLMTEKKVEMKSDKSKMNENIPSSVRVRKLNHKPRGKRKKMNGTFAQKVFLRNNNKHPIRKGAKIESIKCELRNFRLHIQPNGFRNEQTKSPTNPPLVYNPHFSSFSLPAFPTYSNSDERVEVVKQVRTNSLCKSTSASIITDKYHGPDLLEQYRRRKRPPIRNYCTTNHPLRQMYSLEDLIGNEEGKVEGKEEEKNEEGNIVKSKEDNEEDKEMDEMVEAQGKMDLDVELPHTINNIISIKSNSPSDDNSLLTSNMDFIKLLSPVDHAGTSANSNAGSATNISTASSSALIPLPTTSFSAPLFSVKTQSTASIHSDCYKVNSLESIKSYTTAPTGVSSTSSHLSNLSLKSDNATNKVSWKIKLRRTFRIIRMKFKRLFTKS